MVFAAAVGILIALLIAISLAGKWQLEMGRVVPALIGLAAVCSAAVALLNHLVIIAPPVGAALICVGILAMGFVLLLYRFYRDPERLVPDAAGVIVSPADGEVLYIRESREGRLPVADKNGRKFRLSELTGTPLCDGEAVTIGIAMNFLDVHVNRAPIAGRVTFYRHFPGSFGSLRQPETIFVNERATTVIARDGIQVAVVQIASRLVRQIVSFVKVGEEAALGQRIGMIRFGSQVDLVLPLHPDLRVLVRPGERVFAGSSIIAVEAQIKRTGAAAVSAVNAPPPHRAAS